MAKQFNPTNVTKLNRAQEITDLVLENKKTHSPEDEALKATHTDLLSKKGISLKDPQAVLESVYETLGGSVGAAAEESTAPKAKSKKKDK